ncbi:ribosome-associated translation inhibitor RaiA [Candidatus Parcubacteria bacterium]|jgi:ribosomal subunit interface protein|nr:MAG: ribosome-associated translation inhibitor RaiA [Candidatus Parcubacteria bacterium]
MIISSKNFKLTPSLKNYAERKFGRLTHLSRQPITQLRARLDFDKNQKKGELCRVEASVVYLGKTLKAGTKASDMHEAIDLTYEKLERRLRDAKELWLAKRSGHHGLV